MDVLLDGTPMLGHRTGIGQYVTNLYRTLHDRPDVTPRLYAFTIRHGSRPPDVHPGAWTRRILPARLLQQLWLTQDRPSADVLLPRADVLHATNFTSPPSRRARRVVTVHDLAFLRLPETVHPQTRRAAELTIRQARRADAVLTPSAAVAAEIQEHLGIAGDRVHVTPLGVDDAWAAAAPLAAAERRRLGLPDRYLLAVGTREPRKNLGALVAAHRAAGTGRVPPLVLVGPAGWGPEITADPGVHVLPYLPAEELRGLVAGATALVFPSRYEGFGLPALEAMATGTPVLANDIPVLREVLGECGTFVDADDRDALVAALEAVGSGRLEDGDAESARAARRERARSFTWARCADATVAAYRAAGAPD
ncbi:Glycosyltransferase involved in cell wall bisynthesis [Blastococcus haudaquaticus]|uniref:Glycosyltransferase involved in cell wall bisynthesis n=2 Tax=Blastococcus haudaquaticus TaxID=1938745 RepID=A0A286GFH7_9ACTN|nr:Glycosyltransferase involved in cell wall bisynthesis [Blastococcus haudaquaticus]